MDYILRTIERKINRFEGMAEAKIYHQVRVEYSFYLLLAYFWNENFEEIGIKDFVLQGNIIKDIQKPSIGTIADLIQKLDLNKEFEKTNKAAKQNLTEYALLRNDLIGHGYSFEDDLINYSNSFDEWYQKLKNLRIDILTRNTDLIICERFDEITKEYVGTIYDYEGDVRSNWRCSSEVYEFEIGNLYASYAPNIYHRLSPFIHIDIKDDGLYVYRNIQQPLLGKIRYNRIDRSDKNYTKSWEEFEFSANNGLLKKQPNGCIINIFHPNYKRYIEVGSIKEKVYSFLTGKEKGSSVCITLWGHGGNGKTATVQKICEEISLLNSTPPFEFIIFLSAKDRELNKYTGKIDSINSENRVTSFDDIVKRLNLLIYSEELTDINKIIGERSKILIVIDDYETFDDSDQSKITNFIKQLDTSYHKVIITTRNSFLKIGDDIQTNELNESNTIKFLLEVLEFEHNYTHKQIEGVENEIKRGNTKKEIYKITLGKPIEIIRFANCFVQKGKLSDNFLKDVERINTRSERNEFLYGRNYAQLSGDKLAQDIFTIIGLLTPPDTLTSLVKHIKLILNKKDEDEITFNLSLDKLVKLRLIEIDEDGSYKVDSKDILEIMRSEYDKRNDNFKSGAKAIYDRIKSNITADTDRALLSHVKTLRHQGNPETTIQQYKEILKQGKDFSYAIKLEALLDLTDFLFNHRGDKEAAIRVFDEYFDKFYEYEVLKRYASYTWSINKERAIKILEDFYAKYSHKKLVLNKNEKLHILALIVLRESQFWNDKYEKETGKKKNREEMQRVFNNFGHLLFAQIKNIDVKKNLSSEESNDISFSLDVFSDICYRIDKKDYAIDICSFGLGAFPERHSFRFKKKLKMLNGERLYTNKKKVLNRTTEFGELLKQSLKSLDIINLETKEFGYDGIIYKIYNDSTKYGYIKVDFSDIIGRVYFRESDLKNISFDELKIGDKVEFGFDKINNYKYGAINISKKV